MPLFVKKTHCKWGHEFTPENTKLRTCEVKRGKFRISQVCKTCARGKEKNRDKNLKRATRKKRYRNDAAYRERRKQESLNRYYERKNGRALGEGGVETPPRV